MRGTARLVNRVSPVGEPDGGSHSCSLHDEEPGHQNGKAQLATHGIDVGVEHLEGYPACAQGNSRVIPARYIYKNV